MKRTAFFLLCLALIPLLTGLSSAAEKVFYYHTDPAGSTMAISDDAGNIVWRATYKPFGQEQSVSGSLENNERFIGKEKDKETGLVYINHRYFKPEIGRFISPDEVRLSTQGRARIIKSFYITRSC
ncbi:MAG: RHS domain-containing protein [Nitrospiraceae bacterium]|nr:RHS domain-containing protein [Nitrospiraceae bacterium]